MSQAVLPRIYLDSAATGLPKPPEVEAAMVEAIRCAGNPGRGLHGAAASAERIIGRARLVLGRLLGADDPRRVILTLNGTDALNIAINAVVSRAGGGAVPHVVTTVLEHNSVLRPIEFLRRAGRVSVTHVGATPDGFLEPAAIAAAVRPDTVLVAFTLASNAVGTIMDGEAIVRAVRARGEAAIVIDASQAAGAIPVDAARLDADFVAAPGHKGLQGPMGTGVLLVGRRASTVDAAEESALPPFRSGGTGGDSTNPIMPPELPHRLEGGTPNVVGAAGLAAGVEWILERGVESIRAHERALVARMLRGLAAIPGVRVVGTLDTDRRVGIVPFTLEGWDPFDLAATLEAEHEIAVRPGLQCAPLAHKAMGTAPGGTVRASVGPMTTEAEVDAIVAAVTAAASSG